MSLAVVAIAMQGEHGERAPTRVGGKTLTVYTIVLLVPTISVSM